MRGLVIVLLAGCWSGASTPPATRPPEPERPRLLPVPTGTRTARIAAGKIWFEIAVDGTAERAQALCELAVKDAMSGAPWNPELRIARDCDADALPQVRARAATLLVNGMPINEESYSLGLLAPRSAAGDPARGTVTKYEWFADRAACERAADELRAAADESQRALEEATRRFIQAQLDDTRAEATQHCGRPQKDCTKLPGTDRMPCETQVKHATRRCQELEARIVMLDQKLTEPVVLRHPPTIACR